MTEAGGVAEAKRGEKERGPRPAPDARLLRGVRWRLLAWSAGSTLVVLVLLGGLLYTAVARSLEAAGTAQLRERARAETQLATVEPAPFPGPPEFVFGGPTSGTLAVIVGADRRPLGPQGARPVEGLPDRAGVEAALAGREDIRTTVLEGTPVRILTTPVEVAGQRLAVQVVQDRTAEERTLNVLLVVLGLGGVVAVALSLVLGYAYAGRALVPIRTSLARQREFAAEASHELRTPLAILRGSVEHLRRHRGERVEQVGAALDDMEAEVGRLTRLVDDLLLLARTDSGAVQLETVPTDLAEVAVGALPALQTLADSREVRLQLDPAPSPLVGDPGRLRQLVTILVDNAIRHSPAGGTVLVTVRGGKEGTTLTVEDEGRGIREEDLARIFERFWRAPDAPSGGSGLGLSIARWIAEQHGGSIRAANRPEGGARLEVRLPGGRP